MPTPAPILRLIRENQARQEPVLDLSYPILEADGEDYEYPPLLEIPPEIDELTHLRELHVAGNVIQVVPVELAALELEFIDLCRNPLREVADIPGLVMDWGHWLRLQQRPSAAHIAGLWLRWMGEESVEFLQQFPRLRWLDLQDQRLDTIPEVVFTLQNLSVLNLSYNELTTLPEAIAKLQNLLELDLRNTDLVEFPEWIADFYNLRRLYLQNTDIGTAGKINNIDVEIFDIKNDLVNIGSLWRYFTQLKQKGKNYIYEAKLLIIGEGGAGKTTLRRKLQNTNAAMPSADDTTHGIEVEPWEFKLPNGHTFRLNIWDFGGQEIYHATHQFFLTKRSLYALVADTRKENTNFYYWLNIVELLSDNSPVFIVKNARDDRVPKIDEPTLRARFDNLEPSYPCNLACEPKQLQAIRDFIHFRVQQLPQVGSVLPNTWVAIRRALEAKPQNTLEVKDYYALCEQHGMPERDYQRQLSEYLHDLGVCLHFRDDPILHKTLILKPEWGTDAVYKVVFDTSVQKNFGKFSYADIQRIWCDAEYTDMHSELLQLMKNFKLCYELPEGKQYIAPRLLAEERPKFEWNNDDNLILRYEYVFMPKGILHQLIVQLHNHIENNRRCVWQYGVVFNNQNHTRALVIEDYNTREIQVRIAGKHKRDFMTIIDHELQKIHDAFNRLKYEKWIPCQCEEFKNEPEFFDFVKLKEFDEDGVQIQCQKRDCRKMLDAWKLLEGVGMRQKEGKHFRQTISRGKALMMLKNLTDTQFMELVFVYEAPKSYFPNEKVSQVEQAIKLLEYVEQKDGGYVRLMAMVEEIRA